MRPILKMHSEITVQGGRAQTECIIWQIEIASRAIPVTIYSISVIAVDIYSFFIVLFDSGIDIGNILDVVTILRIRAYRIIHCARAK